MKSDYTYGFNNFNNRKIISIVDLDLGKMSVTNNIDDVVDEILKIENINPSEYLIVYKDSEGRWDGWDYSRKGFISLDSQSKTEAIMNYISLIENYDKK